MTIVPKSGRKSTAHSRTKSGRKSQRKRLVFQWHNAQKQFWGKKVEWPGFGPDILTEELTAARPLLIDASHAAVQRAILDWTKGGSRQAPSTEIINRPRATR
jgi:hypothetical protein